MKGDEKLDGHEYIGDNLTRARNEIFFVEPKAHDEIHKNPWPKVILHPSEMLLRETS